MLKYLIEKEFKQLFRNPFLPRLIVLMPVMMMLILPWAATMEIRDLKVTVVDNDHSSTSQRLIYKIGASKYFRLTSQAPSYDRAMEEIEHGTSDIILEIPVGFEDDLICEGSATTLISVNSVNGVKGGLGSLYLQSIVNSFSEELRSENGFSNHEAIVEIIPRYRFNPTLNYHSFMIPALMAMLVSLLCGFLPTLNIVGEKESGTIEQINVSPVNKFTFILSKLIPYWIIGFGILTISFGIAWLVYGLVPAGNLLTIYVAMALFALTISGMGLVVSNYSDTMQQAMFVMFFFMVIMLLMSGLFTPVTSMPEWAQKITIVNPIKYFIQVMRSVYLKGSGLEELIIPLSALACFAAGLNLWAVYSYRKTS